MLLATPSRVELRLRRDGEVVGGSRSAKLIQQVAMRNARQPDLVAVQTGAVAGQRQRVLEAMLCSSPHRATATAASEL